MVSDEKCFVICIGFHLHVMCYLSLAAFKIFLLVLVFINFMICLDMDLFKFILFGVFSAS